ncbi:MULTISPECIES: Beta-galactosidase C-terminal domain [unclassified Paenibacillus]|uniref:Beta-galactosidase C-terminal domain n=1 Tax=unclassified Paenibacillus TaxID=185978 RepID=UPI003F4F6F26
MEITIFLNYTSTTQILNFKECVRDYLNFGLLEGKIEIEPYGVMVKRWPLGANI